MPLTLIQEVKQHKVTIEDTYEKKPAVDIKVIVKGANCDCIINYYGCKDNFSAHTKDALDFIVACSKVKQ